MALMLGTKTCCRCKARKPVKGGTSGKYSPFVCAECKGKPKA
jgi:hypothetical protein